MDGLRKKIESEEDLSPVDITIYEKQEVKR